MLCSYARLQMQNLQLYNYVDKLKASNVKDRNGKGDYEFGIGASYELISVRSGVCIRNKKCV